MKTLWLLILVALCAVPALAQDEAILQRLDALSRQQVVTPTYGACCATTDTYRSRSTWYRPMRRMPRTRYRRYEDVRVVGYPQFNPNYGYVQNAQTYVPAQNAALPNFYGNATGSNPSGLLYRNPYSNGGALGTSVPSNGLLYTANTGVVNNGVASNGMFYGTSTVAPYPQYGAMQYQHYGTMNGYGRQYGYRRSRGYAGRGYGSRMGGTGMTIVIRRGGRYRQR